MRPLLLLLAVLSVPATAQNTAFNWKFQPQPGSKWTFHGSLITTMNRPMPAGPQGKSGNFSMTSDQETVCDYDIVSRDKAGNTALRLTYRSFELRAKIAGMPAVKGHNGPPGAMYAKLGPDALSSPVVLTVSPQSKILGVSGLDKLTKRLKDKLTSLPPMNRSLLFPLQMATSNPIMFEKMLGWDGNLPNQPVKVGDRYTFDWVLPAGITMGTPAHFTRTLVSRSAGNSTFQEAGAFSWKTPRQPGNSLSQFHMDMSMDSKMTGAVIVQEKSGLIRDSKLTISTVMTTNMTMRSQPKRGPSKMTGTTSIHCSLTPRK